jgi:hypothetical protein
MVIKDNCGTVEALVLSKLLLFLVQVKQLNIPASESFDFCGFLAAPSTVEDWNIQGLPADSFSTANGVMVTRGRRWPLLVDPQVRVTLNHPDLNQHGVLQHVAYQ